VPDGSVFLRPGLHPCKGRKFANGLRACGGSCMGAHRPIPVRGEEAAGVTGDVPSIPMMDVVMNLLLF
jgi:hypothetical protein